ncbi:MAG: hypothetical protein GXP54_12165, partial [Deltaproteobacteria bacterium]|nr:hypothetical protein [Deltaproteobacteria bacterium]
MTRFSVIAIVMSCLTLSCRDGRTTPDPIDKSDAETDAFDATDNFGPDKDFLQRDDNGIDDPVDAVKPMDLEICDLEICDLEICGPIIPDAADTLNGDDTDGGPGQDTVYKDSLSEIGDPCEGDGDCAGLVCDPVSGRCVECVTSVDCKAAGKFCRDNECLDWECAPGSRFCEGSVLVTCSQEGDGPVDQIECDDGDICTEGDVCLGTGCVQGTPKDCDDDNECTADACDPDTGCVHLNVDIPCDDGNPCTIDDHCLDGTCIGGGEPGCDDANPCTDDECVLPVGCRHEPNTSSCDDADPCALSKKCVLGLCTATSIKNCDDQNTCTLDSCDPDTGQCQHAQIPQCGPCVIDSQCDDGNPCSVDGCANGKCVHYPGTAPECCMTDSECDDQDPCTTDDCTGSPFGTCSHLPAQGAACCDDEVFLADFVGGSLDGFELDPPQSGVGWRVVQTPHSGSAPWALYYGNPVNMNYDSGKANEGTATGPEITLPAGVELTLRFTTWQDVEKAVNLDYLEVTASTGAGDYLVWRKPMGLAMNSLTTVTADISALQARKVRLGFRFSTADAEVNDLEGVYIDDIEVFGPCVPAKCIRDLDCWSLGMGGSCVNEACDYTQVLAPIRIIGSDATGPEKLDSPFDVSVSPGNGKVFVSDKAHHRVRVFTPNGELEYTIGSFGTSEGMFNQPHGLASSVDRLYVADTQNHRIQVFTIAGVFMFAFGEKGDGAGLFNQPKDVALTPDGEVVYIADTSNHRIQAFDKDGVFLFEFGSYGKSDGLMRSPSCVLTAPDYRVLVCDTQNHRIQVFAFDGVFIDKIKPTDEWSLYYPYGAVFGPDGRLVVADTYHHRIEVFDQTWK